MLLLLFACGAPGHTAIVRPRAEDVIVKIKGEAAAALYAGMTEAEEDCRPRGCKRRGRSLICSTLNLRDPVVCEVRLSPNGHILPPSSRLYHSAEDNRHYGAAALQDEVITMDGAAGDLVSGFTVESLAAGRLVPIHAAPGASL